MANVSYSVLKPEVSEKARALITAHGPLPALLRPRPTPLPLSNMGLGAGPSALGGSVGVMVYMYFVGICCHVYASVCAAI